MSAGILCMDQVRALINPPEGQTTRLYSSSSHPFDETCLDPSASAIDLPLGENFWEMKGSCRTGKHYKVLDLIRKHALDSRPKSLTSDPITLRRQHVYLFKADCELDLVNLRIEGKATG